MKKVKEIIRAVWDFMKKIGVGTFEIFIVGVLARLIFPGVVGGRILEYSIVAGITLAVIKGSDVIKKWWKGVYKEDYKYTKPELYADETEKPGTGNPNPPPGGDEKE